MTCADGSRRFGVARDATSKTFAVLGWALLWLHGYSLNMDGGARMIVLIRRVCLPIIGVSAGAKEALQGIQVLSAI